MVNKKECPHHVGHRKRLKEKLAANPQGLWDYEVLELLLSYANPRRDNKELAKNLLEFFDNSLFNVFSARMQELREIEGFGQGFEYFWLILREFWTRVQEAPMKSKISLNTPELVVNAAKARIGTATSEEVWVALVDNKNRLVSWEKIAQGTLDQVALYKQEVLRHALIKKASGIVLVHNHPSGDPRPSLEDRKMTRYIYAAAKEVDVRFLDHIIVAENKYYSFQEAESELFNPVR